MTIKRKANIGIVVSAEFGAPFVHMHLESWKRNVSTTPLMVHALPGKSAAGIQELCAQYGCQYLLETEKTTATPAVLASTWRGLQWAKTEDIDLLVVFSDRFIPLVNWVSDLQQLAESTQYAAYSNQCTATGIGFRTECMALQVDAWFAAGAVDALENGVLQAASTTRFCEAFVHGLARAVHYENGGANHPYERRQPKVECVDSYGDWKLLGTSRMEGTEQALWHQWSVPREYSRAAFQYGLQLSPLDFDIRFADCISADEKLNRLVKDIRPLAVDIHEHLNTLTALAGECNRVTEFGTREGYSTAALLAARPKILAAYDVQRCQEVSLLEQMARSVEIDFRFYQTDVLTCEIDETDLLFIDTLHIYEQTRLELRRHADRVSRYLVFHDTTSFGHVGQLPGRAGIWPAIEGFLDSHAEWELWKHYPNNNGLTVLKRRDARSSALKADAT